EGVLRAVPARVDPDDRKRLSRLGVGAGDADVEAPRDLPAERSPPSFVLVHCRPRGHTAPLSPAAGAYEAAAARSTEFRPGFPPQLRRVPPNPRRSVAARGERSAGRAPAAARQSQGRGGGGGARAGSTR